jgi:hypothetical protein
VNAKDKQKVVHVIKFLRCTAGNLESSFQVWVRGHNVDTPRWSRWLKDDRLILQPVPPGPPSREHSTYWGFCSVLTDYYSITKLHKHFSQSVTRAGVFGSFGGLHS